ncbi:MAG: pseudouridine synthase [Phycisphaerales bacterium JB064]
MPSPKQTSTAPKGLERLQRILADAGVASRRACEDLIREGMVEVNGQIITDLPAFADPRKDDIRVNGRRIRRPEQSVTVVFNKPTATLTTAADEPGMDRRTVMDIVQHPLAPRLFPVGRLDYDTTGLLILTNDGELANRLAHPRYEIPKTYRAIVSGVMTDESLESLERGVVLAHRTKGKTRGAERTQGVQVTITKQLRDRAHLEITLTEGRNREVRRVLARVGCPVRKLERVAIGPVKLAELRRGHWRDIRPSELKALKIAVGLIDADKGKRPPRSTTRPKAREPR